MDLLSGSYSRMDKGMAGLFQVLWGSEDGFQPAKALNGTDDEPLIIPASKKKLTDKICTRPFAADIDNDGDLDLVVGNFGGSFYTFNGKGDGKFDPKPSLLKDKDGKLLKAGHHSDPFLIDWDNDGDLDMVSGSSDGGVSLAINVGDKEKYEFTAFKKILPGVKSSYLSPKIGTSHLTQPQGSTRVWVADINDDGKFDILVGDSVTITEAADGVKADEVEELLADWQKEYQECSQQYEKLSQEIKTLSEEKSDSSEEADGSEGNELTEREKLQEEMGMIIKDMSAVHSKRDEIVSQKMTGFVWVYYQK